ncbi:MAG: hypothetical protein MUE32_10610 [Bacteroidales bacterium]|jgi:putative membrane protein|nr:hypothetical protein [Bacteroidales bacterium]
MKQTLSVPDKLFLENLVAEAEKQTGVQVVLATTPRSGAYPEIPWKAFSAAASLATLAVFITGTIMAIWSEFAWVLYSFAIILGSSVVSALVAASWPFFSKLFLSDAIAEMETRQHAASLFLSKELYSTTGRKGVLILLSEFERRVVILPDRGLNDILSEKELERIIGLMKPLLAGADFRKALELAISELTAVIAPSLHAAGLKNELSDRIIEDKGI